MENYSFKSRLSYYAVKHFILIPQCLALWKIQVDVRSSPCSQWDFSSREYSYGEQVLVNDKWEDGSTCVLNEKKVLFSSSTEIVV